MLKTKRRLPLQDGLNLFTEVSGKELNKKTVKERLIPRCFERHINTYLLIKCSSDFIKKQTKTKNT